MGGDKKLWLSVLLVIFIYCIALLVFLSYCTMPSQQIPVQEAPIEEPLPELFESEPTFERKEVVELPVEEPVEVEAESEPVTQVVSKEIAVSEEEPESKEEPEVVAVDQWADFYVAGQEDYSLFEGGTYYIPLFVNEEYVGDINSTFTSDDVLVDAAELQMLTGELLIDSVNEDIFAPDVPSISLQVLKEKGVDAWFDYQMFTLHMGFPPWMMKVQYLSIYRSALVRPSSYPMAGSSPLESASFSWFSNISAFDLIDMHKETGWQINPASLFSIQVRNSISLFDVYFDFSFSVHSSYAYTPSGTPDLADYITFQGIQGFYDFPSQSLRLSFGNVNDYLGYDVNTFGIALEKRFSYGSAGLKSHQLQYEISIDEPSTVEVFINGRSVYRKDVQPGIYKLRDFIFTQGANKVHITVTPHAHPLDTSEYEFVIGYDEGLLAKGDTLYSASLTFPGYESSRTALRFSQQFGLNHTITPSYSVAVSIGAISLDLSALYASPWGSFTMITAGSFRNDLGFGGKAQLTYRTLFDDEAWIDSFTFSFGYEGSGYSTSIDTSIPLKRASAPTLQTWASLSGRLGSFFGFALDASASWKTDEQTPVWSTTFRTSFSFVSNLSVDASVSLQSAKDGMQTSGRIGLNYSFTPALTLNASSDFTTPYVTMNASWQPIDSEHDSVRILLNSFDPIEPLDHQGAIVYNHTASLYDLSIRGQYSDSFSRFSTSIAVQTAFAYANGLFGMTRAIADNFLLVKPQGAWEGKDVVVARTMESNPHIVPSLFGVSTYTSLIAGQQNNLMIYGVDESLAGSSTPFLYHLLPQHRTGYAVRVHAKVAYAVAGTLLYSPHTPYKQYATDLLRVEVDEQGTETLVLDETLYLFTDEHGFFFISGLTPGEYQFKLSVNEKPPLAIRFTIDEQTGEEENLVFILETVIASDIAEALEREKPIEGPQADERLFYRLAIEQIIDETTFWDSYYPTRFFVEPKNGEKDQASLPASIAIERMAQDNQLLLFDLARISDRIQMHLDAIDPLQNTIAKP